MCCAVLLKIIIYIINIFMQTLYVQTVSSESENVDIPHIMISYQWGSQATMVAVKERLKAEGFKVWMDVDNMSK